MQNNSVHNVTLESVAHIFANWRKNKQSKFSPIPDNLKALVNILLPHYSKKQIINTLKLSTNFIKKLQNNQTQNSQKHDNINFIPFQLNKIPDFEQITSLSPTNSNNDITNNNNSTSCQIYNPGGTQLIINTSNPDIINNIINIFLCSSSARNQ